MKSVRLAGLIAALYGFAQSAMPATPPLIVHIEGKVHADGQSMQQSGAGPAEIRINSQVSTGGGRAEVILSPGVTLRLGENSSFRMLSKVSGPRIQMLTGSAFVVAGEILKDPQVTVVCEDAVTVSNPGVYRFDANPAWWAPDRGAADVRLATVNVLVKSGQTINLSRACQDMIPTDGFDINDADRLDGRTHYFRSGWIVDNRRR
jgi:hypothetical protein